MNATVGSVLAGVAGLVIGAGAIYGIIRGPGLLSGGPTITATCDGVVPRTVSTSYGLYLTDGAGGHIALATIHFYPPGGFRHNIAVTIEASPTDNSGTAATYDLSDCNPQGSAVTMSLSDASGTRSQWTFTGSPAPGSGGTWGVTVQPSASNPFPAWPMSGNVYPMK